MCIADITWRISDRNTTKKIMTANMTKTENVVMSSLELEAADFTSNKTVTCAAENKHGGASHDFVILAGR